MMSRNEAAALAGSQVPAVAVAVSVEIEFHLVRNASNQ